MKSIMSTAIVAVSCFLLATPVTAQQGQDQGQRRGGTRQMQSVEERVEELSKVVGLTDAQKKEITTIWTEQREAMRQRFQESGGQARPQGQRPQQGEADAAAGGMRGGMMGGGRGGMMGNEALEKVLTPDQMTKYSAFQEQNMISMRVEMMDRSLDLTADQKNKIIGIITEQNKQMTPPSDDEQDRRAMQQQMRKIQMATDKAIEDVLTKEQVTKYRAMPRGGARR